MEAKILFFLTLTTVYLMGVHSTRFTVHNNCPYTIYPAFLSGTGAQVPSTASGFELLMWQYINVDIFPPWSGRIWARYLCSNTAGRFSCLSGDCNTGQITCNNQGGTPPATLAQFTLKGEYSGKDSYAVSIVDGFNLPVKVESEGGKCGLTGCPVDINAICPNELQIKDPNNGAVIGCKSGCLAFNDPKYCCTGVYAAPELCTPTNYSLYFKGHCPNSCTYAYDVGTTITCPAGTNYHVTFCP